MLWIISKNIFHNLSLKKNVYFRFFQTLDWQDVYYKQLKPPIIPKIKSEADTANFENYPEADFNKVPAVSDRQIGLFADF